MSLCRLLLVFVFVLYNCSAVRRKVLNDRDSFVFLNKFGYNPCSSSSKKMLCSVEQSSMIRAYQKYHGLKVSGILDRATNTQMNRPRCGNSDVRAIRWGNSKWSHSSLTWSLHSYPNQISKERTTAIIKEAFNVWSTHIPLEIKQTCDSCRANFVLKFERSDHGCQDRFDGPSGVLAHAAAPEHGIVHFDADEPWTEASHTSGINLYLVAVHEIGHALGLDHDKNQQSIMFSTYISSLDVTVLSNHDRQSIQEIYGAPDSDKSQPREPDPEPGDDPNGGGVDIGWNGKNWALACDFNGNDLSRVQVSAAQCGPECDSREGCTHFVWTKENGGTCWLKKGSISKSNAVTHHDRTRVCGVASGDDSHNGPIGWRDNWAHGCDFSGNDLSNIQVPGHQCGPECESTNRCTHFVWTKKNGGTCWLKMGRISKSNAIPKRDQSIVCGVAN